MIKHRQENYSVAAANCYRAAYNLITTGSTSKVQIIHYNKLSLPSVCFSVLGINCILYVDVTLLSIKMRTGIITSHCSWDLHRTLHWKWCSHLHLHTTASSSSRQLVVFFGRAGMTRTETRSDLQIPAHGCWQRSAVVCWASLPVVAVTRRCSGVHTCSSSRGLL